jgi:DNA-binding NarL/FixJ family response regulator
MICKGYSKAIKDIKSAFPNLSILITSSYPEANYAAEVIGIGASGCLEKECTPCELLNTVRKISSCK